VHSSFGRGPGYSPIGPYINMVPVLNVYMLVLYLLFNFSDLDQIAKIFQVLGTPTEETWPGHTKLPDYVQFKYFPPTPLVRLYI
jgi:hypothetical protein